MGNVNVTFILDHKLMPYRLSFFDQLVERGYNVTVIHPGPILKDIYFLKQKVSRSIKLPGGVQFRSYKNDYGADVIIHMQNIRILNLWMLTLNPFRKYKIVHWGIGVSSARGLSLNKTIVSRIRGFLSLFASAVILYSDYPKSLFPKSVYKKLFIANNTVYNPRMFDFSSQKKNSFLFIGALNARKGLEDLIISFSELDKQQPNNDLELNIIGEGGQKEALVLLSIKLNVHKKINFLGQISSYEEKEHYFKRAIASISPKQAGLSVLESFSYGIPFIAYKDAISGGEHLNIINGENGYLVDCPLKLTEHLIMLSMDNVLAKRLGRNAFEFYRNNRQMKHMVDVFDSSIQEIINK